MPKGKAYLQYLENTKNKAEIIDRFTKYTQQELVLSKLKGNVISNSRGVTYRINSSELKTLFTFNREEADTKIVCCCSRFNKPCIVKAKGTDIIQFLWFTYMQFNNPSMQTDKDSLVNIRKIYETFGSTTCLLLQ